MLTNEEKTLISYATCDLESGNHLLYKRSKERLDMLFELIESLNIHENERSERQNEIVDVYYSCLDPNYKPKS